jgi:hypothetical protein
MAVGIQPAMAARGRHSKTPSTLVAPRSNAEIATGGRFEPKNHNQKAA